MDATIEELKRKLENDSDNLSFAMLLADAYCKEDQIQEALKVLKSATEKHPSSSLAFYKLGECAIEVLLGDVVDSKNLNREKNADIIEIAATAFNRAVQLKPDYVDAINRLATLKILMAEPALARELLLKSLDLKPNQPDIVELLADLDKKKS